MALSLFESIFQINYCLDGTSRQAQIRAIILLFRHLRDIPLFSSSEMPFEFWPNFLSNLPQLLSCDSLDCNFRLMVMEAIGLLGSHVGSEGDDSISQSYLQFCGAFPMFESFILHGLVAMEFMWNYSGSLSSDSWSSSKRRQQFYNSRMLASVKTPLDFTNYFR
jgi:hypothetical protein